MKVTEGSGVDYEPRWSPDSKRIAFERQPGAGGDWDVLTVTVSSGEVANLTPTSSLDDRYPDWSPDGKRLVFGTNRDGGPMEIYTMAKDGSDPQPVTANAFADFSPAFSPDGTRIAFVSFRSGNRDVFSIAANGMGETNLSDNPSGDFHPDWQPACTVVGTDVIDTLTGTPGDDLICGLGGDDAIDGLAGNDRIFGGGGADTITAGDGKDIVYGWLGMDVLKGGAGKDQLNGVDGSGSDTLNGGPDDDICVADRKDEVKKCP